ncbi:MAG: SPFH domain-containing protein [Bryobacteraceae bacterium]|nr:SPFH domain-containing protein [Bryobacteraceae bacterium]
MNTLLFALGTAAALVTLVLLSQVLFGWVLIKEDQVGHVVKKFGSRRLPPGRLVAVAGEAGYQAEILPPGLHFWYWPWMFRVDKKQVVRIEPGRIGMVVAKDGAPLPADRILARRVECDNFQDAVAFLRNGGQKGKQSAVLTAGLYRINLVLFEVFVGDVTNIPHDKVGIVTTFDGAPMPKGEMAAPSVEGHSSFQDPEAFLANGGCRGLQEQIILAGQYNLNPWFVEVKLADLYEVPIGWVGVVVSFVGRELKDISGEAFTHGNIVPRGGKGVWSEPLYPGKHPLNTDCMRVELVPTTNIVLNWANARTEAHKLDEKLSTISVRSRDGFTFNLDVSQIINIGATKAPWVISRVGSVRNLVNQVLEPLVGNYFRNSAQNYIVLDFLSARSERQKEAREHISRAIADYDVQSVDSLIGDITPPQSLMDTLTARKLAEEQKKTYEAERLAQETRKTLEAEKALAEKQRELVNEEQNILIAQRKAQANVRQAEGESTAISTRAAGEAEAIRRRGTAEAEISAVKGENEARAIQAVGLARAEAARKGVEAMGEYYGLLQIFSILAEKGIRLTPDVLVAGGGGSSGSASDAVLALLAAQLNRAATPGARGASA